MDNKIIVPLVEKAQAGDKQAYAKLCEEIIREVLYVCIKITGDVHSGEDAAQDTLIQLGHNIKKLRRAQAFPAWLNRCITNSCREHLRKERQRSRLLLEELHEDALETSSEFLPAQWAESQEQRRMILDALQKLPARQQHLLLMYYFEEMSLKEIAVVNRQNEATVRSNLRYARGSLKKQIEKSMGTQLSALPAVAAIPTITLVLHRDAARLVTEQSAKKVLLAVGSALTGGAATVAGIQIATLAASIAPAAAALVLVAATTLVGSPSPSHPPAGGIGITPQYSDSASMQDGGEGDLYSTQAPSGPPAQNQPASSIVPEYPATQQPEASAAFTATGQVLLTNGQGGVLAHPNLSLRGICVQAYHNDILAAEGITDATGRYTLSLPDDSLAYTLRIAHNAIPEIGPQNDSVVLLPGTTEAPVLFAEDKEMPQCVIWFLDEQGQPRATVNPATIEWDVYDATPCEVLWTITALGATVPARSGSQSPINIPVLGLAPGRYTLSVTVTDLGGNQTIVDKQFTIR